MCVIEVQSSGIRQVHSALHGAGRTQGGRRRRCGRGRGRRHSIPLAGNFQWNRPGIEFSGFGGFGGLDAVGSVAFQPRFFPILSRSVSPPSESKHRSGCKVLQGSEAISVSMCSKLQVTAWA